jgi:hypothetical protein
MLPGMDGFETWRRLPEVDTRLRALRTAAAATRPAAAADHAARLGERLRSL